MVASGIILNNQMRAFSTPDKINEYGLRDSPLNFISPGKRPMTSMTPTIIVAPTGDVRMVLGATDGPRITSSVAVVIRLNTHGLKL